MLPNMSPVSLRHAPLLHASLALLLATAGCDSGTSDGSSEVTGVGGSGPASSAPASVSSETPTAPASSAVSAAAGAPPALPNPAPTQTAPAAEGGAAPVPTPSEVAGAPGAGGNATAGSGGMPQMATAGAATGGSGQGGSTDAGIDPCAIPDQYDPPTLLSQTGLYSDTAAGTLGDGVRPYEPRFKLWSDGATKSRWVYIPPCGPIDTSDPDYWHYPIGFTLWKEFDRENADGELIRIETRMLHKYSKSKWFMTAYIWNDDQTDAAISDVDGPDALVAMENAKGTEHDVPGQKGCEGCHYNMADKSLGFTAIQLDRDDAPDGFVTLATLEDEGLLSDPIPPTTIPGTPEQVAALGYIHANCGHCHNPYSKQSGLSMQLWLQVGALGSVETTDTYLTTVGIMNQAPQQPDLQPPVRVVPGNLDESAMYWRMIQPPVYPDTPEGGDHMPLIGTSIIDDEGVQLVADWINSLAPTP